VNVDDRLDRARRVIAELRDKLTSLRGEPIAIVGMACRFPGDAHDCDSFWRMVRDGRHAVRTADPTRGDLRTPIDASRPLALLDDLATFDAGFFDVSPREAVHMDPQQRMFLEVAWEALEDAGQTRARLAGSDTATYVGIANHSSGYLQLAHELGAVTELSATGNSHDVIAGRLAYWLDLRGATMVVNTACSSSLVAVHLACVALLAGECRTAIAAGVNAILESSEGLDPPGMLAGDGRCKTFDARADGYGRGEGCGVVVLKRLSHARADRDRVHAIIRATVTNQDGRTNGLTAPNGVAQRALLRRGLERAGIASDAITYVEAHGTGTALGDPIEVEAIADVYGADDGARACALGAAKANVNHLEGAAGIAGLIKAVLALRERTIPPVAGFDRLNPLIALDGTRLVVPREAAPWHADGVPRTAAVSSFSWSGTNAHAIVEEACADDPARRERDSRAAVVVASAADEHTARACADALAARLDALPDDALEDVAWTTTARRTRWPYRIAAAGGDRAAIAAALRARDAVRCATVDTPAIGLALGDDERLVRDAAELYATEPAFRAAADVCARAVAPDDARSPFGDDAAWSREAAMAAAACGMHALLRSWGVAVRFVRGDGRAELVARYLRDEFAGERLAALLDAPAGVTASAVDALRADGATHIIAFGARAADARGVIRYGDAPDAGARSALMHVLAGLVEAGFEADWDAVFDAHASLAALPAYPFRRRRYWIADGAPRTPHRTESEIAPDAWFFETVWDERDAPQHAETPSRTWIIVGAHGTVAAALASAARAAGDEAVAVERDDAAVERACDASARGASSVVVDLRALRACDDAAEDRAHALTSAVAMLETRLATAATARLCVVTRGAQTVRPDEPPADVAAAALWGFARCAVLRRPDRWAGIVDCDPSADVDGEALWDLLRRAQPPAELAYRDGRVFAPRLMRAQAPPHGAPRLDATGTYVVTGAFGAIGARVAAWLAERGATHLALIGRASAHGERAGRLRDELRARGVDARIVPCDVADASALAAAWAGLRATMPPIRGIVHAAGRVDAHEPGDAAAVSDALRAKVDGTVALERVSADDPVDVFVAFSSAAARLGDRNRPAYGAANAFLDAAMAARRARGKHGVAIAWGLWSGLDAADDGAIAYLERSGMRALSERAALDALGRLMDARGGAQPMVAHVDVERLASALASRGRATFVERFLPAAAASHDDVAPVVDELRRAAAREREARLTALIGAEVRGVLELADDDPLEVDRGFFDLGMDSHMTVMLRERLERIFGVPFPGTLALEHPTVRSLVAFVERAVIARTDAAVAGPDAESDAFVRGDIERDVSLAVGVLDDAAVEAALAAELRALEAEMSS